MTQPTMQQVAERAGVSTALVSLVMREAPNVSDYRRQLVLKAADELGYRPNVLARNLASRRTRTIGIVLNDLHNPFFAEVADGLQHAADTAGYRVLYGNGQHSAAGEAEAVETLLQFRVDGIVLAGALEVTTMERAANSTAIVVVGRTDPSTVVDTVNTDDRVGATMVVDHLVGLGHERIGHLDGGRGAGAAERADGYRNAMIKHGLGDFINIAVGDYFEEGGHRAAAELMTSASPPTAIFAANDLSAVGALDYLLSAGHRVPADVSVVGFDNIALAALTHVSLTTVDQPTYDLGTAAIELLLDRLDGERTTSVHVVRAPTFVERSTTGPPPTNHGAST